MRIAGKDFQGLKHFDFEVRKGDQQIALIVGKNGAGKSRIARAIGWGLTGHVPVGPKDIPKMIGIGASSAEVQVFQDDDKDYCARITFKGTQKEVYRKPEGAPNVSVYAAGIRSLADEEHKDRIAILNQLCKTEPTEKDLIITICDGAIGEEKEKRSVLAKAAYKLIESKGWDKACDTYSGINLEKKREWEKIAGTGYKPVNADKWLPTGWSLDMSNLSEETISASLVTAQTSLEAFVGAEAVDEHEREAIQLTMKGYSKENTEALKDAKETAAALRAQYLTLTSVITNLKTPPKEEPILECIECKAHMVVVNPTTARKPATKRTKKEQEAIDADIAKKSEDLKLLGDLMHEMTTKEENLASEIAIAKKAYEQWQEILKTNPPSQKPDVSKVEAQRREIESLKGRLDAYKRKRDADDIHGQIQRNTLVISALAQSGLRADRTAQALTKLNDGLLKKLCEVAEWKAVEIGSDLKVRYDNFDYTLGPAASEQFRARVTLQCALAILDGSEYIVIDAADMLDDDGRNGLFALLDYVDTPAIVTMTMSNKDDVPNNPYGKRYFIEDAKLTEMSLQGATR